MAGHCRHRLRFNAAYAAWAARSDIRRLGLVYGETRIVREAVAHRQGAALDAAHGFP
jgi:hypothetical protein